MAGRRLTWADAVRVVADATAGMERVACEALALIPRDEWEPILIAQLVSDARAAQREAALRAERNAERKHRRTTGREWAQARQQHWARQKTELGLPQSASTEDVLSASIEAFKAEIRIEWTEELLGSKFALGDGRKVAWGEATVHQHKERLRIFRDHAKTNLEGAARHQAAIDTLKETGAACLNEACLAHA